MKDGVTLTIRAKPRARRNSVDGERNGALVVSVTAAPEDGAANDAIKRVIAEALGVRIADVSLLRGGASRDKVLSISGLSMDDARRRLAGILTR